MKILSSILWVIAILLVTDVVGWWAWAISGQMPVDGFYVGAITSHVIKLFF